MQSQVSPRHFDDRYDEHTTLRDGTAVRLRLVRPDDKERLVDGFERMSPEARYQRFLAAKSQLTAHELRYLTETDGEDHVAVGAAVLAPDGSERGLGVARFVRLHDRRDTAEAAFAVVDEAHGKGLGSLLFRRLMSAAHERGVTRFVCSVLASNDQMHELLRDIAPDASRRLDGHVVEFEFAVPALGPRATHEELRSHQSPHQLLVHAARRSG
jgi:GNAT superfamily N-acetyltransferase